MSTELLCQGCSESRKIQWGVQVGSRRHWASLSPPLEVIGDIFARSDVFQQLIKAHGCGLQELLALVRGSLQHLIEAPRCGVELLPFIIRQRLPGAPAGSPESGARFVPGDRELDLGRSRYSWPSNIFCQRPAAVAPARAGVFPAALVVPALTGAAQLEDQRRAPALFVLAGRRRRLLHRLLSQVRLCRRLRRHWRRLRHGTLRHGGIL